MNEKLNTLLENIKGNRMREWRNAYSAEYKRILDDMRDAYFMLPPHEQTVAKAKDSAFHAWERGKSDVFPNEFIVWAKDVVPFAFSNIP